MGRKISSYKDSDSRKGYHFHCEGCGSAHGVLVDGKGRPNWNFNGNEERPTFKPSILVRWVSLPGTLPKDENGKYVLGPDGRILGAKDEICHSFVTDGKIQYLKDSTHHLSGKTVHLIDF